MTKRLDAANGTVEYDKLINSGAFPHDTKLVTVASGEGKLAKGTALSVNESGKMVILGTEDENEKVYPADCILAEDVDATSSDAQAVAFQMGKFNVNHLIVKTGYTLSEADIAEFRKNNITFGESIA